MTIQNQRDSSKNKSQDTIKYVSILFLALALIIPINVSAADVVSNSADWRDVYSTILYGNLGGLNPHFLTGTAHGPIMLYEIPVTTDAVEIVTSADRPFYVGYQALFNSRGYQNVEESVYESANLDLARLLPNINKFIIIDDAYGYNALAIAPYAAKAKYYVIFANSRNIDDVEDFLQAKQVEDIIIYGHTDREVRTALAQYSPEILNSDTGSRFENNLLILDKYAEIGSIKQVILTNGEFIEASMMSGNEPVLFIGKNNVPAEIKNYIQKKGIEIGVLIGNELIGSATDIRRQLGISVFVKFARGSRVPGGTISPVEDLDRFPMPSYRLSMSITSISYNRATRQLEITYTNNVDLATYFSSTITLTDENGQTIVVLGDQNPVFIDGEESKTVVYSIAQNIDPENLQGEINANIYTIFGESKTSLENVVQGTYKVETIDVQDNSDIEIISVVYDKSSGKFIVTVKNIGNVDAYTNIELVDLWINGAYVTISSADVVQLKPGETKEIFIEADMDEEDLENSRNSKINVRAIYGERKHALVKVKTAEFDLQLKTANMLMWVAIGALIIILLWLLLFFFKRRKKKCERCRTMNKKDATHCKKCGHPFHHSN